jgi:trk system potassium uptake protein TrkH
MRLRARDGFAIVVLFWVATSFLGAVPLVLSLDLTPGSALFEVVSGLTTTGATVLSGLDSLPQSINYYRLQLHWIGGIGVIVLAVAILPMLGVGGMQLLKAEASGPLKDDKLTPRIAKTAQYLSGVYVGFTVVCALAYWLAGMTAFDAICHAMSTISTGGFSTHDASLAWFDSLAIELIACAFMFAGALPFTVHFLALRNRAPSTYGRSGEIRLYVAIIAGAIALTTLVLLLESEKSGLGPALRGATFTVISVITSTGFTTDNFSLWPTLLPTFIILISCVGGCAGSTAGGLKVIRVGILARNSLLQIPRLVHPTLVRPLTIEGRVLSDRVTDAVWGFFTLYVIVFGIIMLLAMVSGMDQISAFGAVAATINNMGPGLGEVASSFASVDEWMKYVFAVSMLLGRLELFTLIVMLHPDFWRA